MGGKKKRIRCKIDDLPEEQKNMVRLLLMDTSNTYLEISEHLRKEGYDISKSAVGRYALRQNAVAQRLCEAQEQTKLLVEAVRQDPDVDYTEATMRMLMTSLTERIATAQEEFDKMDPAEAGRLVVAISRTRVYKDRVRAEVKKKIELAFQGMEADMMAAIKSDPELAKELKTLLQRAKEKMMQDD